MEKYLEFCDYLLKNGADINSRDSYGDNVYTGYTPLHIAVKQRDFELVEYFVNSGKRQCKK
jgi:ankyrin repeat protein